jgi:hypothetical protein
MEVIKTHEHTPAVKELQPLRVFTPIVVVGGYQNTPDKKGEGKLDLLAPAHTDFWPTQNPEEK